MRIIDSLLLDVGQSIRRLRRSPSVTITAVAILAVGIGANTAVFSIVNSVLLRPLSYSDPDRIYSVGEIIPQFASQFPEMPANARHFLEWKRCTCFDDVAMLDDQDSNLSGVGEPERISAARVTPNFFSVLGVGAQVGRTFSLADENDERIVVLSDALWRSRFGGDPAVVGRSIELNGESHTVVGVLPRGFRNHLKAPSFAGVEKRIDVYTPWRVDAQRVGWAGDHNYPAVARLPAGKTQEQALAEFNVLQAAIADHFEGPDRTLSLLGQLTPLKDQVVERGRAGLLLLLGAIGTVLLIACLNLGNLMLIRALARGRETAIRAAPGAGRARIFRSALIESLVIAGCGALLGVVLAFNLILFFDAVAPSGLPRADEVSMDSTAIGFAVLLSIGAAVTFGVVPALRLMRGNPQDSLRGAARSTAGASRSRLREWLVSAEVGLSGALLIVAGLLIASFVLLDAVERGYDVDNILTAEVSLPASAYPRGDVEGRRRFYDQLVEKLEAQAGVVAAGVTSVLPLRGDAWADIVTIEGDERPIAELPIMPYRTVSPDYLSAMGIALYSGRQMQHGDFPRRVAIISRSAAERMWPGQDPIGKHFRRGVPTEPAFEVVGVADDVRTAGLDRNPPPIVYVPLWERSPENGAIAIRTTSTPFAAAALLRASVQAIDPSIPVSQIVTMSQIESDSTAQRRFQTVLVTAFAAGALLLAAIGIYGVVAYSAAQRTNEIGVRMALGARPRDLAALVLRGGVRPIAIGLGAGIVAALAIGGFLSTLLFGVEPTDPPTFVAVAIILAAAALLACWVPARRAARIAPLVALHYE